MNEKIDKNLVSFMYMLKISAIKSIKTSVTTIVKITDRNAGMQNDLNCQITRIRKTSAKLFTTFPNFYEVLLKQFVWTLDVEKFRTIMLRRLIWTAVLLPSFF